VLPLFMVFAVVWTGAELRLLLVWDEEILSLAKSARLAAVLWLLRRENLLLSFVNGLVNELLNEGI
jgi:hypothetical protein